MLESKPPSREANKMPSLATLTSLLALLTTAPAPAQAGEHCIAGPATCVDGLKKISGWVKAGADGTMKDLTPQEREIFESMGKSGKRINPEKIKEMVLGEINEAITGFEEELEKLKDRMSKEQGVFVSLDDKVGKKRVVGLTKDIKEFNANLDELASLIRKFQDYGVVTVNGEPQNSGLLGVSIKRLNKLASGVGDVGDLPNSMKFIDGLQIPFGHTTEERQVYDLKIKLGGE